MRAAIDSDEILPIQNNLVIHQKNNNNLVIKWKDKVGIE